MKTDKPQLAAAIKQQVQHMQALITEAEEAGLDVKLTVPHPMALGGSKVIEVEVSEKLIY